MEIRSGNEWQGAPRGSSNSEAERLEATYHRKYCPKTASPACLKPQSQGSERRNSAFIPLQNPGAEVGVGVPHCCTRSSCSWCHWLGKSITFPHSNHCRWLNIEWVWVGWFCYSAWAETPWVWIRNFEFWISTRLNFTANSSPRPLAGDWPETNICFHYYFFCVHCFIPPRPTWITQPELSGSALRVNYKMSQPKVHIRALFPIQGFYFKPHWNYDNNNKKSLIFFLISSPKYIPDCLLCYLFNMKKKVSRW